MTAIRVVVTGFSRLPARWRPGRPLALAVVVSGLVASLAGITPTWSAESLDLRLEPALPLAEGGILVPLTLLDATGRLQAVTAEDLAVRLADRPLGRIALERFAPGGGRRSAVAVLVAGPERRSGAEDWRRLLGDFASAAGAGALRAIYAAGDDFEVWLAPGGEDETPERLQDGLARDRSEGLWDAVLEALRRLDDADLPDRRVLVLIAGSMADRTSAHPLAACVEAAKRARVAIYAVADRPPEGAQRGALQARLDRLTATTGGRLILADPADQPGALRRLLRVVDGAQALLLPVNDAPLPAELTVRVPWADGAVARTTVQARSVIEARGRPTWLLAVAALLVLGGTSAALMRRRRQSAGVLEIVGQGEARSYPVRGVGLTLGSGPENQVVLADRRVSRAHAVLRPRSDTVVLTDLRSTNGTLVNGRQVVTATLRDGDRIVLGGAVELIYRKRPQGRPPLTDADPTSASA